VSPAASGQLPFRLAKVMLALSDGPPSRRFAALNRIDRED
jgi:hypothetical protein